MRMPRGQIIDNALQRVGNTTQSLIAQARHRLNRILQDLAQQWDWPHLWVSIDVTIQTNGALALPDNFLKPEDRQSLMLTTLAGQPRTQLVVEVDHITFWKTAGTSPLMGDTSNVAPVIWTIDYGTLTGRCYPLPSGTAAGILRCKLLPLDFPVTPPEDYDADIPRFPYDSLLVDLLFEWAQSYEVDPRRAEQLQINEAAVMRVRGAAFPEQSFPSQIPLDPLFFSTPSWGYGRSD